MRRKPTNSSSSSPSHSSSIESNSYPSISSSASSLPNHNKKDLSTDLRLGLTFSTSASQNSREQRSAYWPPIKTLLRSTLAEKVRSNKRVFSDALDVSEKWGFEGKVSKGSALFSPKGKLLNGLKNPDVKEVGSFPKPHA